MTKAEFSSFTDYYEYPPEEMKKRSAEFSGDRTGDVGIEQGTVLCLTSLH